MMYIGHSRVLRASFTINRLQSSVVLQYYILLSCNFPDLLEKKTTRETDKL